jgi:hypothetical protein
LLLNKLTGNLNEAVADIPWVGSTRYRYIKNEASNDVVWPERWQLDLQVTTPCRVTVEENSRLLRAMNIVWLSDSNMDETPILGFNGNLRLPDNPFHLVRTSKGLTTHAHGATLWYIRPSAGAFVRVGRDAFEYALS